MITKKTQIMICLAIINHAGKGCKKCRTLLDDIAINVDDNCLKETGVIN